MADNPASLRHAAAAALLLASSGVALAGEVEIVEARFAASGGDTWTVHATLRHADTGWDHYADAWRVVTPDGRELGRRVLLHPHVEEQPFTRSQSGIAIPSGLEVIFVEARDTVHGWSPDRLEVRLDRDAGPRYRIER
jgi:hypothetical protein